MMLLFTFWEILIAAIVGFFFGWIWFHPVLFGTAWKNLHKFTKKEMKDGQDPKKIGMAFVATFVTALGLAIAISAWGSVDVGSATIIALIAWLGFVATHNVNYVLWGREPEGAYIINTLYAAVQMVLMAVILAL